MPPRNIAHCLLPRAVAQYTALSYPMLYTLAMPERITRADTPLQAPNRLNVLSRVRDGPVDAHHGQGRSAGWRLAQSCLFVGLGTYNSWRQAVIS